MSMEMSSGDLKVWSKGFSTAPVAGGKTAGTYDKIGTIKVPNKKIPVYIIGILLAIAGQAQTAGESGHPEVQIDSTELNLSKEKFSIPKSGFSDPIGTNSNFVISSTHFEMLDIPEKANNKETDVSLSSSATMTVDWDCHASFVFSNKPVDQLPADFLAEIKNDFTSNSPGRSRIEQDAALAIGSADADVSCTGIKLLATDKELIAISVGVVANAPTAAEEHVTRHRLSSGDVDDFDPQEWPGCIAWNPTLGTVVGGAKSLTPARKYPTRFPLPESNFTLDVAVQNVIAITNGPDTFQELKVRRA